MKRHNYSPIVKGIGLVLILCAIQIITNLIYQQSILANFQNFIFIVAIYLIPYSLSFTKWNLFYQFLIFLVVSFGYFTATSFLDNSYVDYSSAFLLLIISIFAAFLMTFFSLIIRQERRK
ncbi:MAG: hypothetical protein L0J82_11195 [Tetragenococcus koreensis]|nr:hypothetical protein [Tetragenococcus koreensis]MDN6269420.1 hypothetical protein [Tetragenococcus koreensis]MDN6347733.1 hypothetical protein [Tetragenococcus koreensis]